MSLSTHRITTNTTSEDELCAKGTLADAVKNMYLQVENQKALRWQLSDAYAALDMANFAALATRNAVGDLGIQTGFVANMALVLVNGDRGIPEQ